MERPINTVPVRVFKSEYGTVNEAVANAATAGTAATRSIPCESKSEGPAQYMLRTGRDEPVSCGAFQEAGTVVPTLNTDSIAVRGMRLPGGEVIYIMDADYTAWLNGCNGCCTS